MQNFWKTALTFLLLSFATRLREAWPLWFSVAQRRDFLCLPRLQNTPIWEFVAQNFQRSLPLASKCIPSFLPPAPEEGLWQPALAVVRLVVCGAKDPRGVVAWPWRRANRLLCPAEVVIKASGAQELLRQIQPEKLSITLRITVPSDLFFWHFTDRSKTKMILLGSSALAQKCCSRSFLKDHYSTCCTQLCAAILSFSSWPSNTSKPSNERFVWYVSSFLWQILFQKWS